MSSSALPTAPEKPPVAKTAFQHFVESMRDENESKSMTMPDLITRATERWKSLPALEKKPFQDTAHEDSIRHADELKTFNATMARRATVAKKKRASKKSNASAKNKKSKSRNTKKDQNAPKRPKSAYNFFVSARQATVKEKHPDLSFPEIAKELGRLWNALDDDGKAEYIELADCDTQRYVEEIATYTPPASDDDMSDDEEAVIMLTNYKPKKRKARKTRDLNAPKRARSAFNFFSSTKRDDVKKAQPSLSFGEVAKEVGRLWNELDSEGKAEYSALAVVDKERYDKELAEYTPPPPEDSSDDSEDDTFLVGAKERGLGGSSKERKRNSKGSKDPNAPKRARTAFNFFSSAKRNDVKKAQPSLSFGEVAKEVGRMWNELGSEGKADYNALAIADKERYDKQLAEYAPSNSTDSNLPKRARTAFNFFSSAKRDDVKTAQPSLSFGEVAKEVGRLWNELDDEGKAEYNALAVADKERYQSQRNALADKDLDDNMADDEQAHDDVDTSQEARDDDDVAAATVSTSAVTANEQPASPSPEAERKQKTTKTTAVQKKKNKEESAAASPTGTKRVRRSLF